MKEMKEKVELTRKGAVGIVTIDNPPVNALSRAVAEGIRARIEEAAKDDSIRSVVLIGAGKTFIAGGDIKEMETLTPAKSQHLEQIYPLLSELEDCPKPLVCALHGTAFGGGLEVAQACHYRVALASAKLGQPEVNLGLIPGAGGTQRLPRLVGVAKGLEMCAGGRPIRASEALELGLIDRLVEGDLLSEAITYAEELAAAGGPWRKTRELEVKLPPGVPTSDFFAAARKETGKRARGMLAPFKAIEAVEAAVELSFEEGCRREGELFRECLFGEESKALFHVFLAERETSRIPGIPPDLELANIASAGILGCGTMGGGIAMAYANAGIPVKVLEVDQETLERGLKGIRSNYLASVKKGRLTQEKAEGLLSLIEPALSYDALGDVDIVVEAVFESMDLKKTVFAELDRVCKPEAILATNTSSLDLDEIAGSTSRPQQVIGHHFFSPAHIMRLLEVVRGRGTSEEVIASSMALAKRLRKVAVLAGNCRGFIGNRMLFGYVREAQFLVEEGAAPEQVDAVLHDFGLAMGPFAMLDLAGIDVGWRVRQEAKSLEPPGRRQSVVEDRLYELGRYGQKTSAGWYRYEKGDRRPLPDPEVHEIIEDATREAGIERREIGSEEILERTLYPLINEAARLLEEGIALRAGDIDVVYVYGYGFPARRGGPLWYADTVGLEKIYKRIRELEAVHGEVWQPAPLLERLAREGNTFSGLDSEKRSA
jgi:3-hydroxyacyl-CoA dehydrogenase